tara:strand:- start:441 stop:569 length:129 start_codon:yes stop_codon:yes gene_type:complete
MGLAVSAIATVTWRGYEDKLGKLHQGEIDGMLWPTSFSSFLL